MDPNVIMIGFIILIIFIYAVIRYVVNAGANKAEDAIKNAWARRKNATTPPQQVSLAERYGQTSATTSGVRCGRCGATLPAGTKFCNKCGADLSGSR